MNRIINSIFFLFALNLSAQNYKAKLSPVKEDGLHLILPNPEVRSAYGLDMQHFRIMDAMNREVSYAVLQPDPKQRAVFLNFPILLNESQKDSVTSVVVENKNGLQLNNLVLTIANTSISKEYSISGSYDNERWYGLVNAQTVHDLFDSKATVVEKTFAFPLNRYKYLKFDFKDKNSLPVNVTKAGIYENGVSTVMQLPLKDFKQRIENDIENKTTTIFVTFKTPQLVNRISLAIATPYFLRRATVNVKRTSSTRRRKSQVYSQELVSFQLNSALATDFPVGNIFEKEFAVTIDNQDNQPLDIKSISLLQDPLYVVADLKAGTRYSILIDSKLTRPSYDLAHLQLSDVKNREVMEVQNFEKVEVKKAVDDEVKFWQTPFFMWTCIILGVVFIGFFALQLLKDLNRHTEA